jgi:hypothetical protein
MIERFFGGSWKTTGAGISAILIAVGSAISAITDNDPATTIDIGALSAALVAGLGLIFARDNDKSSRSLKVK